MEVCYEIGFEKVSGFRQQWGPASIDGINLRTFYLWHAGFVPEYPEYPQYSGIGLPERYHWYRHDLCL